MRHSQTSAVGLTVYKFDLCIHTGNNFILIVSLKPMLSFLCGGGKESLVHTVCTCKCQNSQKSWEFRFFCKISCILLSVNYRDTTAYFNSTAIWHACWCLPSRIHVVSTSSRSILARSRANWKPKFWETRTRPSYR